MEESPAAPREVSLGEAVAIAIRLQQHEQFADAEGVYRGILAVAPDHPDALHYCGVVVHQQGRSDEGIALIERSLALEPAQADWHSNLGIVLQARGRLDEAIAAYRRAIALDPQHANAHNNLGVLLRAQGQPDEAEAAYRTAIRLHPNHIDAYTNLGILFTGLKRMDEAVACFCKVITLRPRDPEARRLLALAHCKLGELDKAVEIFEEWLGEEPDEPIARHMLAACSGRDVPARASDAFVAKIFDGFSASFESKLEKLSYRAPALVDAMLADWAEAPSKQFDILDAGCGTGLCGPRVAPYARSLVGVDLSAGMLSHAKEKQVYDTLVQAELTEYLRTCARTFDVVISADTLVYFGVLNEIVAAVAAALRPGGVIVFTLEEARDLDRETGFRLEPHGRYSHSRPYIERVLADQGLAAEVVQADLRLEAGSPVAGLVIRASRLVPEFEHAASMRGEHHG